MAGLGVDSMNIINHITRINDSNKENNKHSNNQSNSNHNQYEYP